VTTITVVTTVWSSSADTYVAVTVTEAVATSAPVISFSTVVSVTGTVWESSQSTYEVVTFSYVATVYEVGTVVTIAYTYHTFVPSLSTEVTEVATISIVVGTSVPVWTTTVSVVSVVTVWSSTHSTYVVTEVSYAVTVYAVPTYYVPAITEVLVTETVATWESSESTFTTYIAVTYVFVATSSPIVTYVETVSSVISVWSSAHQTYV
jgi:hypothetical protein